MGVVNVTPDSFYDGGRTYTFETAVRQAESMMHASSADIIDIGGESTRPGGDRHLAPAEEADRVLAVVEHVAARLGAIVLIDTSSPEVMKAAVQVVGLHY